MEVGSIQIENGEGKNKLEKWCNGWVVDNVWGWGGGYEGRRLGEREEEMGGYKGSWRKGGIR